ncbi:peptide chain release factor N(5)-glutamine methyltransferase [Aureimonas pseudogalii]|uniref:peptide chain release factor N(5)-glutamine methyltransferase n=1 Tax=Aureimonas pseudogalii TaxID=1744844 RepID=UPI001FEA0A3A
MRTRFRVAGLATPELDARLLVMDTLGLDAAALILRGDGAVSASDHERLEARATRRLGGEPVHRILGRRAFFDHEFALSPETLEPRPDTEVLVLLADEALRASRPAPVFADVGTGTGAIGVSLLALDPARICVAVDLSAGALATAIRNAGLAGTAAHFLPVAGDYLAAFAPASLDAVVSNPPYIPCAEIDGLAPEVRRFDPMLALDGGADGLDAYRRIAAESADGLRAGGDLLFEIGLGQEADVRAICAARGFVWRETRRDLAGIARALWFRRDIDGAEPAKSP